MQDAKTQELGKKVVQSILGIVMGKPPAANITVERIVILRAEIIERLPRYAFTATPNTRDQRPLSGGKLAVLGGSGHGGIMGPAACKVQAKDRDPSQAAAATIHLISQRRDTEPHEPP